MFALVNASAPAASFFLPRHPVHVRRGISLEGERRQPEQIDVDVVEEHVNFSFFRRLNQNKLTRNDLEDG
jgi:hypothetical protein